MNNLGNNKSRLEKLQDQLYQNDFKSETDNRNNLEEDKYDLGHDWEEDKKDENKEKGPNFVDLSEVEEEPPKKTGIGFFGYILILAGLFFLASVGYAAYVFLGTSQDIAAEDININIVGPVSIGAGEILSLDLIIQNNNPVQVEAIDLIIEYPNGTKSSEDLVTDLRRTVERIDPISPGGVSRETLTAALFGEEGDNKEIKVSVEYQALGSSAIYKKEKVFSIILNAAPARVAVFGLDEVSSGQEIELEATITSNSNTELKNLMVVANYPFGFQFLESDLEPTYSDNVWVLESLGPNSSKTIKIKGTITGQNTEERIFRFSTGLVSEEDETQIGVVFNNFIHEMIIQRPFVGLNLLINGSSNPVVVARSGSEIVSELVFSNNTNDFVRNLDIRLSFNGDIFRESTVRSNDGFYRSIDNTLIFNRDTSSKFREIDPREQSSSEIKFDIEDLSRSSSSIRNPEIKINAYLEGDRMSSSNLEQEIKETFTKTIKIVTDVLVGSYTLRNMGPFENTGPIPPKAEESTDYTIQWSISNSYNNLENARITAVLPTYVTWNNRVSPSDESIIYDETTRQLVWNIGNIGAGAGQSTDPKTLYFQVSLLPSLTQVGSEPILLRNVFFTATDSFTQTNIEISGKSPDTVLSDSDAVKGGSEVTN